MILTSLRIYALVTGAYWGFTITDGGLRMRVVLHFYRLGYNAVSIANAGGRLLGTLASGVVFQLAGFAGCLWTSAALVLTAAALSLQLPKSRTIARHLPASAKVNEGSILLPDGIQRGDQRAGRSSIRPRRRIAFNEDDSERSLLLKLSR